MAIYVLGHKKPDLDSIVSAIACAELRKALKAKDEFIAGRISEINPETRCILKKFKAKPPKLIKASDIKSKDQVILVDHNEKSQRLDGLNPEQIIEIIDHHKINLNLNKPIKILIYPWGAASTILYFLGKQKGFKWPPKIAALLLCAILSDTGGFKYATTTDFDKKAVKELQKLTKIQNLDSLVFEIFKAKSDISGLSSKQVVTNDYKIYNFSGRKIFINQLETIEQEEILKEKEKYLIALEKVKQEMKLDFAFFAITDILKQNTKMLYLTLDSKKILEKAFEKRGRENVIDIGHRLSRKKQIVPEVEKTVKGLTLNVLNVKT